MIRIINTQQILVKLNRFIVSAFGSPAPDHIVLIEIGSIDQYNNFHIPKSLHFSDKQLYHQAASIIPNFASEIMLYGNEQTSYIIFEVAKKLEQQGYFNIYICEFTKDEWISLSLWIETEYIPADNYDFQSFAYLPRTPQKDNELPLEKSA